MTKARTIAIASSLLLITAACSSGDETTTGTSASGTGDPNTDKLAQILDRGTLVLSTDPEYPPQSFAVEGAERASDTKCSPDQLTADEITGYDAETGKLVAASLGVEPCFVVPTWTEITGGNWGDRWDISFGSGSINEDRMQRVWMTQPYYAVPNSYFVAADSPYRQASDLDGERVGACASCSHEMYLRGDLVIPGIEVVQTVDDPEIVTFNTEVPGLKATARGEIDAFLCSEPVGAELIADGASLRMLETPAYATYKTGYVDRNSGIDVGPFIERVDEIVDGLHRSGILATLSVEYFGKDYATAAGGFDLDSIGQSVQ